MHHKAVPAKQGIGLALLDGCGERRENDFLSITYLHRVVHLKQLLSLLRINIAAALYTRCYLVDTG